MIKQANRSAVEFYGKIPFVEIRPRLAQEKAFEHKSTSV
jgi:hypothetical protein